MFKKYIAAISAIAILAQPLPAFAAHGSRPEFRGGIRGGGRGDFHREFVAHRLPAGYISLMVAGLTYLYCEGLFYRYTPVGYVIVQPPMGALVPGLPPGYTMIIENGVPYYVYGYTYYAPAPGGYVVAAAPPAVSVPIMMVAPPVAPVVPAAAPVPAQLVQMNVSNATATEIKEKNNKDVFDIYIPNGNGSYTLVTLRKTEKGFLGPQGEFYSDHPTVEQLRERYAKK
ncbi:MAG: hypothetical protein A3G33_00175 [Omnitrophica bacterium RIFCSPLOWO2_12_FULL_44_17]|uniref:Uncharacterized protein n=1 Tax=Candidatus Danuiimicrobium aquiferis TaxID=1801832 RepID=A0A1G1KTC7_9BACT|nr:MAG: hypothetical protein A3B72_00260 [Omnitrophica bacterium RIFCSPHIGHO2_02_FULL_45_28]OGW96214.1 MAG: hypothetical protein A3G33_00175 [Omnitrophica bacterium RIFCSPLOWO2_12_FULL_44_17]OGX02126.1 MAG: hypothetical protein A3J12_01755 [Omnitrophica bacterium RIFCSPLOWO2_02_FULL_44_11]